ncbi:MAG: sulfatase-like hydrolase/transferase, partial [Bryobacterales bacterium]|nr:sulfatase-like hydrolase/transferase [Bryobacterales bacterium]
MKARQEEEQPMNRKDFLKAATGGALGCGVVGAGLAATSAGQRQVAAAGEAVQGRKGSAGPNVLFLFSDQHRADYLSCCHDSPAPTPEIDRIAARGVRFSRAVCPYPVCAASRMSLLTGRYPHTTGVINNTDRLAWNARTVAHHFADAGYHTGLIGKM